jgi:hypothetical protein
MGLKSHLEAISNLHDNITNISSIAESMSDSTIKGRILSTIELMQKTADEYTEETISLYEKILDYTMRGAK